MGITFGRSAVVLLGAVSITSVADSGLLGLGCSASIAFGGAPASGAGGAACVRAALGVASEISAVFGVFVPVSALVGGAATL